MSEENLVDIFTEAPAAPVAPDENLVTAIVSANEDTGYVSHVHFDIKKPQQYHLTSDGIAKDYFENSTLKPTGDKVRINIQEPKEEEPKYKSTLFKTLPYKVYSPLIMNANVVLTSDPPQLPLSDVITAWYHNIFNKPYVGEMFATVADCLDEIVDHYEHMELEYEKLRFEVEKQTNHEDECETCNNKDKYNIKNRIRELEDILHTWKIGSIIAGIVVLGYILIGVSFQIFK